MLCLQLSREDVSFSSGLSLVDRADVYALVLFITNHNSTAKYNWYNAKLLLRFTLFKSVIRVPSCTFDLQSKDESSVTLLSCINLPVHLLLNFSLNVEFVELE